MTQLQGSDQSRNGARTSPHFDLAVLGGGSAGFAAAIKGAELGARVALIEGSTIGGTCVNVGCIPSKTLLRAAEAQHRRTNHGFAGISETDGQPDWSAVRAQKDELVHRLRQTKYIDVLREYESVAFFHQHARLVNRDTILLADGTEISAPKIVIATGASPMVPAIPGLAEVDSLNSTTAMNLDRLPKSIIVLGGGSVGLELGQMFARLGVEVTMLEMAPSLIPSEDPIIGDALAGYLAAEGLHIHVGARVECVERQDGVVAHFRVSNGEQRSQGAEQLVVATGRSPNSGSFGLDAIGVRLGGRGEIVVDGCLRTSISNIYAAGDVTGDPMFVYVAAYAGTVAAENALSGDHRNYDVSALPRVTFTDPAVASVGLSEREASARGIEPLVSQLGLDYVPRALAARDTRGFVRLVADAASRRLIGAQILAPEAGEMVTEVVLAIRENLTIEDITGAFHPYLTQAEGIKLAAQAFTKDVGKLSCCAA